MADLVHCYNKGCGQKFDPTNNQEGKKNTEIEHGEKDEGGGGGWGVVMIVDMVLESSNGVLSNLE